MLQPSQNNLLARFGDFTRKKDLIENSIDLTWIPSQNTNQHPITHHFFPSTFVLLLRLVRGGVGRIGGKRKTDLVKIKHQVQLTHIPEKTIQHFDKEVNSFQIRQLIIIRVDANTKEEPRIPPINYFERAEFDKIGLMLLIPRRNQAVHFTLEFDFFFILWGKTLV